MAFLSYRQHLARGRPYPSGDSACVDQVSANLLMDFQVGYGDTDDVRFAGQRARLIDTDAGKPTHMGVDQIRRIEELTEVVDGAYIQR